MAKIKNIKLNNFRNFENFDSNFNNKLNIFFGNNGCGKTNILEAISLITKGRGIRNSNISNLIKNKKNNFYIKHNVEIKKNDYEVNISTEKKNNLFKKVIKINDDSSKESLNFLYQSISYLLFLPEMERLFQTSPSYRRNFIDRLIYSSQNDYNTLINKYKKHSLERTQILHKNNIDDDWLNYIEKEISSIGMKIYELRSSQLKFINDNIKILKNTTNFQFDIELKINDNFYNSETTIETYLSSLKESRNIDKQIGGTKIGPHKTDISAIINNDYEALILSTGQQKTIVLMILLAQCNYLVHTKKITPIILFDEIGSHLDKHNRNILLNMIDRFDIQFFLTGTDKNLFSFISTNAEFYNITKI